MRLGIDIDDTLISLNEIFMKNFNKKHSTKYSFEDMTSYDFSFVEPPITPQFMFNELTNYLDDNLETLLPKEFAKETILELREKFDEIHIITARDQKFSQRTIHWLNSIFGESFFEGIHFATKENTKGDLCEELGITFMLEDALKHAERIIEKSDTKILFFDSPWNQGLNHDNLIRINNWKEVRDYLISQA